VKRGALLGVPKESGSTCAVSWVVSGVCTALHFGSCQRGPPPIGDQGSADLHFI
jgi:hypothetical protein